MIAFSLPYPPSANKLWRAVNGRNIKSEEYRKWLAAAAVAIPLTARGRICGPYTMTVEADRPDERRRDLTNILKPTEDALLPDKKHPALKGVVRDDSDATEVTIRWSARPTGKDAQVHVTLTAVAA